MTDAALNAWERAAFERDQQTVPYKHVEGQERLVSPLGELGMKLPPLMEARRVHYHMPDALFLNYEAIWDRVFLWQCSNADGTKAPGSTLIEMPDTTAERLANENPVGVIVSAGPRALDALVSQGMDVGHMVTMQRLTPFKLPIENVNGKELKLVTTRAGDLTGSMDLPFRRRCDGMKTEVFEDNETGERFHGFTDADGELLMRPQMPPIPVEY